MGFSSRSRSSSSGGLEVFGSVSPGTARLHRHRYGGDRKSETIKASNDALIHGGPLNVWLEAARDRASRLLLLNVYFS